MNRYSCDDDGLLALERLCGLTVGSMVVHLRRGRHREKERRVDVAAQTQVAGDRAIAGLKRSRGVVHRFHPCCSWPLFSAADSLALPAV
jgi:hypothetical protein